MELKRMNLSDIKSLFYITHKDNVDSILCHGILSHEEIEREKIPAKKIYDKDVVNIRERKTLPNGKNLTEYANLYFQPRNPMLYRVLHESGGGDFIKGTESIVLLEIDKQVLKEPDVYISTGNAATTYAEFLPAGKGLIKLNKIILEDNAWWNDLTDGKTKIMAECLKEKTVEAKHIKAIYCGSETVREEMEAIARNTHHISAISDKIKFFQPNKTYPLNTKIKLVKGDMFFSSAQTLTISVNTVGVMGKGLASRTRYQFPDVFVEYQDLCRKKTLKMGKPYLIKREKSIDELLAYQQENLTVKNNYKWFLLFPTKSHWKNRSDFEGIKKGLFYMKENYKKWGIKSIALPALGCGLGKLDWKDVGPLMCSCLDQMDIQSIIYLPMESEIPEQQLQKEFLLGGNARDLFSGS